LVYFIELEVKLTYPQLYSTGKSEGKKPLGRPRCRWKDNIKMNLEEI
jgi:hypothetical protein